MILSHIDKQTEGVIQLASQEQTLTNEVVDEDVNVAVVTIAWNKGDQQEVVIDDQIVQLSEGSVLVLNVNQAFSFKRPEDIIAWQFNREFYCIVDHDHEVSCAGLLFYNNKGVAIIDIEDDDWRKLDLLYQVFLDEFDEEDDNLKTEMLRVILKRLIVKLTRSFKIQNELGNTDNKELDTIREFNVLVEKHFRKFHQVQDYADLLYKSPKTISNLFSKYSSQSPLEVIHQRILLEAKRLLIYTDKTSKQIAYEIGFQDMPGFSRFFKKHTQLAPSPYRAQYKLRLVGKN